MMFHLTLIFRKIPNSNSTVQPPCRGALRTGKSSPKARRWDRGSSPVAADVHISQHIDIYIRTKLFTKIHYI